MHGVGEDKLMNFCAKSIRICPDSGRTLHVTWYPIWSLDLPSPEMFKTGNLRNVACAPVSARGRNLNVSATTIKLIIFKGHFCEKYFKIPSCISRWRIDMPFGICAKPSKDDLTREISAVVEIPNKTFVELVVGKDALGLECLENVASQLGLTQVWIYVHTLLTVLI